MTQVLVGFKTDEADWDAGALMVTQPAAYREHFCPITILDTEA